MSWREQLDIGELTVRKSLILKELLGSSGQTISTGIDFSGITYGNITSEITFQAGATIVSQSATCGITLADAITAENDKILNVDGDAQNLTKGARQGAIFVALDRQSGYPMTGWDGNPDCGMKMQINNRAANTIARGAVRAFDIQARNRSTCVWVKTMELNGRNDSGANCVNLEGLHIRMENYGQVDDDIVGLHVEMSSENDTSSPIKTAVLIRNTDQSGMTAVRDVFRISHTSTNGFTNLFYFGAVNDAIVANALTIGVATSHAIVCSLAGTPIYIPVFTDLSWNA